VRAVFLDKETGDTWTEELVRPPEPGEMVSSTIPGKYRPYQVLAYRGGEDGAELQVDVAELKPLPKIG
jgi:hypothetical protein